VVTGSGTHFRLGVASKPQGSWNISAAVIDGECVNPLGKFCALLADPKLGIDTSWSSMRRVRPSIPGWPKKVDASGWDCQDAAGR
jgi:hypothetical protein